MTAKLAVLSPPYRQGHSDSRRADSSLGVTPLGSSAAGDSSPGAGGASGGGVFPITVTLKLTTGFPSATRGRSTHLSVLNVSLDHRTQ